MNFLNYGNNRFQECVVKQGRSPTFRIWLDAEQNSIQFLISTFRFLTAALFLPVVLLNFVLVNLRLKAVPAPAIDLARLNMQASKNKGAKKLGMMSKIKIDERPDDDF